MTTPEVPAKEDVPSDVRRLIKSGKSCAAVILPVVTALYLYFNVAWFHANAIELADYILFLISKRDTIHPSFAYVGVATLLWSLCLFFKIYSEATEIKPMKILFVVHTLSWVDVLISFPGAVELNQQLQNVAFALSVLFMLFFCSFQLVNILVLIEKNKGAEKQ